MATTTQTQTPDQWFGAIAHTELGTTDTKATTTFLNRVFGMRFERQDGPMEYHMAQQAGQPSCGVRAVMPEESGPSQTPFISVKDIDATIASAKKAEGHIVVPKSAVPGMGYFAWIQVPGGPVVAAWENDPSAS